MDCGIAPSQDNDLNQTFEFSPHCPDKSGSSTISREFKFKIDATDDGLEWITGPVACLPQHAEIV
jgi:hypothetical protein